MHAGMEKNAHASNESGDNMRKAKGIHVHVKKKKKRCRTPYYRNQSRQTIELKSKLYTRARGTLLQLVTSWHQ